MPDSKNGIQDWTNGRQRIDVRLDSEMKRRLEDVAREAGFRNVTAYVRQVLQQELLGKERNVEIADVEQKTVATLNRLSRDLKQLRVQLLATYCLVDGLAKVVLTCIPEPSPQIVEQATAAAKRRYERLSRAVAQSMRGEGAALLQELAKYVRE